MLFGVTAPPRTGKTLYVVHLLLNMIDTFNQTKETRTDGKTGVFIITNISGFVRADEVLPDSAEEVQRILANRDWEAFSNSIPDKQIIIALDECQRFYGTTGMLRDIQSKLFFFLEYHGHWGLNIYLITQSLFSLHIRVKPLLSEHIEISKIRSFKGAVRVKHKCPISYEVIDSYEFKPTTREYNSYKTAENMAGIQKNKTPLARLAKQFGVYIVLLIFSLLVMGYYIYQWVGFGAEDDTRADIIIPDSDGMISRSDFDAKGQKIDENQVKDKIKSSYQGGEVRPVKIFESPIADSPPAFQIEYIYIGLNVGGQSYYNIVTDKFKRTISAINLKKMGIELKYQNGINYAIYRSTRYEILPFDIQDSESDYLGYTEHNKVAYLNDVNQQLSGDIEDIQKGTERVTGIFNNTKKVDTD